MAVWLPALKAVLPYLSNIVAAAIPAFTAIKGNEKPTDVLAQQIAELQSAATRNAESVRILAEQLEKTVSTLGEGAVNLEKTVSELRDGLARAENAISDFQQRRAAFEKGLQLGKLMAMVALILGVVSLFVAVFAVTR